MASVEGYLKKAGEFNPSAKNRYFQLWIHPPMFSYFKNAGGAHIKTVRLQGPADEAAPALGNPLSFYLNTKDRNWFFIAESKEKRDEFLSGFRAACEAANKLHSGDVNKEGPLKKYPKLHIRVPKVIETENLAYFHCTVEAETGPGPEEVQRSGKVLRFSQLHELDLKIRAYYATNYPEDVPTLPPFPPKQVKLFTDHGDQSFIDKRRVQLERYFQNLMRVNFIHTNADIWTYMGLSSFRRSTVLVTNADTPLGHSVLTALVSHLSSPFLIHATVSSLKDSAFKFQDMRDKIQLHEVGSPRQRSQDTINRVFAAADTVVLAPDEEETVQMGLASMLALRANRRRIKSVVLLSGTNARQNRTVFGRQWSILEEQLEHTGVSYTIVRINMLQQELLGPILANVQDRKLRSFLDPDAHLSPIHVDDVGIFIRNILTLTPAHNKVKYQLTGGQVTTLNQICQRLSTLTKEPYTYERMELEEWTSMALAKGGMSRRRQIGNLELLQKINSGESMQSGISQDFQRVMGFNNRSIDSYLDTRTHLLPQSAANPLPMLVVFDAATDEGSAIIDSILASQTLHYRVRAVMDLSDRNPTKLSRRQFYEWREVEVVDVSEAATTPDEKKAQAIMATALQGANTLFFSTSAASPFSAVAGGKGGVAAVRSLARLTAAVGAKVKAQRVVCTTQLSASDNKSSLAARNDNLAACTEALNLLSEAKIPTICLQLGISFQSLLGNWGPRMTFQSTNYGMDLETPIAVDSVLPAYDLKDLGQMMTTILSNPSAWEGKTLPMCAEALSVQAYFECFTEVRRKTVGFDVVSIEKWAGEDTTMQLLGADLVGMAANDSKFLSQAKASADAFSESGFSLNSWRNYLRTSSRQDVLYQEVLPDTLTDEKQSITSTLFRGVGQHDKLKQYQILAPLGLGASGCTVVKVRKRSDGGLFALKMLSKKVQHYRVLFQNEVHILRSLNHPNIVRLADHFEDACNFYMVQHFCAGSDLFDQLEADPNSFTEPVAANMIAQLLQGVYHCHARGVVHRDLKPANIMMCEKVNVYHPLETMKIKMIDFGVAKRYKPEKKKVVASITGTKHYMAPQILDGGTLLVDDIKASDMWSIGVITFVLLTYSLPFYGKTDKHINQAIRRNKVVFPEDRGRKSARRLSPQAKDFILKLLNRDCRYRLTAEQALSHEWIQSLTQTKTDISATPPTSPSNASSSSSTAPSAPSSTTQAEPPAETNSAEPPAETNSAD